MTGVKFEVGATATGFVQESYGDALAKCFRYFERRNYDEHTNNHIAHGLNNTTTVNEGLIPFDQKRVAPSVSSTAASTFRVRYKNSAWDVPSTLTFTNECNFSCTYNATVGSVLSAGEVGVLAVDSADTCYLDFDSEY